MNACKAVMSNKLANQLFFNGSIQCDECEGKRELCQSGFPLHMLVKHCIFIGTQFLKPTGHMGTRSTDHRYQSLCHEIKHRWAWADQAYLQARFNLEPMISPSQISKTLSSQICPLSRCKLGSYSYCHFITRHKKFRA
jgi:hypothetical protein